MINLIFPHFCISMPKRLVADVTLGPFQPLNNISTFKIPPYPPGAPCHESGIRSCLDLAGSPCMGAFPQHENAHKTDLICIPSHWRALVRSHTATFSASHFQILSHCSASDDDNNGWVGLSMKEFKFFTWYLQFSNVISYYKLRICIHRSKKSIMS